MKQKIIAFLLATATLLTLCSCKSSKVVYSDLSYYDEEYTPTDSASKTDSESKTDSGANSTTNSNTAGNSNSNTSVVQGTADGAKKTYSEYNGAALATSVTIHTGSKAMDKSLNFGGKTFTMAITQEPQYHTDAFARKIAAFEKKYNCKIKTKELEFNNYNQQVTQAMSAGTPYDICFMHGSMFPSAPVSNLYNNLTDYFTTADLTTSSSSAGIDLVKTSYFEWKGKITGVCYATAQYPLVIYYNKVLFKANNLEDPLELYKQGKWTWTKIKSMGKKVTDADKGIYFLSDEFTAGRLAKCYGVSPITIKDGKVINNYKSEGMINGANLFKTLYLGSSAIARLTDNSTDKYGDFLKGNAFMTLEESPKYTIIAGDAQNSTAFNKSKDNIGVVPMPLDSSNKSNAYPCGWLTAVCSGNGSSDPRVAVAWAKFCSTYTDAVRDKLDMTAEQKAMCDKLIKGNTSFRHGNYANSSTSTLQITVKIKESLEKGSDISQTLEKYSAQIDACIKSVVG